MDWEPEGEGFGAQPAAPYSRLARVLNASVPLFRVGELRVKLHWSFFLAVLVFASWTASYGVGAASTGQLLLWGLLQATILYSLVLLHEFGHSWMAAAKGRPGCAQTVASSASSSPWPTVTAAPGSAPNIAAICPATRSAASSR